MEEERRAEETAILGQATLAVAAAAKAAVTAAAFVLTAAAAAASPPPPPPPPPAVSKTSRGCRVRGGKHAAASAAVREAWLRMREEIRDRPPFKVPPPPPPPQKKAPFFLHLWTVLRPVLGHVLRGREIPR